MTGEQEPYYEHGYRLASGEEVWEGNYGADGAWTSYDPALGIEAIDMYNDETNVERIYQALDRAGVEGVAIRRLVTFVYGDVERLPR